MITQSEAQQAQEIIEVKLDFAKNDNVLSCRYERILDPSTCEIIGYKIEVGVRNLKEAEGYPHEVTVNDAWAMPKRVMVNYYKDEPAYALGEIPKKPSFRQTAGILPQQRRSFSTANPFLTARMGKFKTELATGLVRCLRSLAR